MLLSRKSTDIDGPRSIYKHARSPRESVRSSSSLREKLKQKFKRNKNQSKSVETNFIQTNSLSNHANSASSGSSSSRNSKTSVETNFSVNTQSITSFTPSADYRDSRKKDHFERIRNRSSLPNLDILKENHISNRPIGTIDNFSKSAFDLKNLGINRINHRSSRPIGSINHRSNRSIDIINPLVGAYSYSNNNNTRIPLPLLNMASHGHISMSHTSVSSSRLKPSIVYRTIIFIRHGNSIWNESTDHPTRTPISAAKAMTKGLVEYTSMQIYPQSYKHEDSIIVDTPLSEKGMKQAYSLFEFLSKYRVMSKEEKNRFLKKCQKICSPMKDAYRILRDLEKAETDKNDKNRMVLRSLENALYEMQLMMIEAPPIKCIDDRWKGKLNDMNRDKNELNLDLFFKNDMPLDRRMIIDILNGYTCKSSICTSNLRRAISTCVLSLWGRLKGTKEKIKIMSDLQEIGVNVDTQTIYSAPMVSSYLMGHKYIDSLALKHFYKNRLDTHENKGAKKIKNDDFERRLENQARYVFRQFNGDIKTHIVIGHSHWFKSFFKRYTPKSLHNEMPACKKKITNCGVIAFRMGWEKHKDRFFIIPETVTTIYGGYM